MGAQNHKTSVTSFNAISPYNLDMVLTHNYHKLGMVSSQMVSDGASNVCHQPHPRLTQN